MEKRWKKCNRPRYLSYIWGQMSYLRNLDESQQSQIEAELTAYFGSVKSNGVSTVAEPGANSYNSFFSNRMALVQAIRQGIPTELFLSIGKSTPFSDSDWSEFLNISQKSLQRYKKDKAHVFKTIHSEKIIELAEVTSLGKEVFDNTEQFYLWLSTPSFALGNMKPFELLKDSYGKELVMNELNRIDQGVFA